MQLETEIASVEADTERIAAAVSADRSAMVAGCPGWTVADLAVHVGGVHRWAGSMVAQGAEKGQPFSAEHDRDDPGLGEWLGGGAAELAGALRHADPDAPMWTMGRPRTTRFWYRRMAQETLVHRWDAQAGAGVAVDPLDSDLAADGVAEMLEVFVPGLHRRGGEAGNGENFHFHRTDGPGEWVVRFDADGASVTAEHAKCDVALRGPAPDLLLALWRRRPVSSLDAIGDPANVARWFALVPPI